MERRMVGECTMRIECSDAVWKDVVKEVEIVQAGTSYYTLQSCRSCFWTLERNRLEMLNITEQQHCAATYCRPTAPGEDVIKASSRSIRAARQMLQPVAGTALEMPFQDKGIQ